MGLDWAKVLKYTKKVVEINKQLSENPHAQLVKINHVISIYLLLTCNTVRL